MLANSIKTEWKKLKHSHLWLVFVAIPMIPALIGTANYLNNIEILKSEWYSLWTQHSLFYANFFYGPLIALYCSYTWRVEHLNHNWNRLMAMPVSEEAIFGSKLVLAFGCTVFLQLWVWILFILGGKATGLPGIPPVQILFWLLRGSLGGMVTAALQMVLSMIIRSFAVPIAVALLGSVMGFLLSNGGYGLLWPYSLMLEGMNANKTEDMIENMFGFGVSAVFFFFFFLGAGIWYLKHEDVRAAA